jgi:phage shock protein PspC (stress-responsive transcriptional regulator)
VCGGLADYSGINPAWFRSAFVLAGLFGGAGVAFYILLWIWLPLEPRDDAGAENKTSELRGVLIGFVVVGAALVVSLLIDDGTWVSFGVVVLPLAVAAGCIVLRRGSGLERMAMLGSGLVLTAALAAANYQPAVGNRVVRATTPMELEHGTGYTNIVSDLTIDLSAWDKSFGYGDLRASTVLGDLTIILPRDSHVKFDSTVAFADTDLLGHKSRHYFIGGAGIWSGSDDQVEIRVEAFSAFGSVKLVR